MNKTNEFCALLYDADNIGTLEWPATEDGRFVRNFLEPMIQNGINSYIDNIHADIYAIKIGELVFPVIVPYENGANSYVCSPYHHYITYGKQFINLISHSPLVKTATLKCIDVLDWLAKVGYMDSVVYVNNWMFSTDLYPQGLTAQHIAAIVDLLKARFDKRAILFRSLNRITTQPIISCLKESGFDFTASRMVYVTNMDKEEIFRTRIFKSDLRHFQKSTYTLIEEAGLSPHAWEEFWRLQHLLSVIHHSSLQPQMNKKFMQLLFQHKLLHFKALKLQDGIKGIFGYWIRDGIMYCPIFGFDKHTEEHSGVYRLLNTALMLEAQKHACFFNQSAGASFYKSLRRAEGVLEYTATYTRHLNSKQKVCWAILRHVINKLGTFYMQRF